MFELNIFFSLIVDSILYIFFNSYFTFTVANYYYDEDIHKNIKNGYIGLQTKYFGFISLLFTIFYYILLVIIPIDITKSKMVGVVFGIIIFIIMILLYYNIKRQMKNIKTVRVWPGGMPAITFESMKVQILLCPWGIIDYLWNM